MQHRTTLIWRNARRCNRAVNQWGLDWRAWLWELWLWAWLIICISASQKCSALQISALGELQLSWDLRQGRPFLTCKSYDFIADMAPTSGIASAFPVLSGLWQAGCWHVLFQWVLSPCPHQGCVVEPSAEDWGMSWGKLKPYYHW